MLAPVLLPPDLLAWRLLLTTLLLAACVTDLRARRIPNALVLAVLGTGLAHALLAWLGLAAPGDLAGTPAQALLGAGAALLVGLPLWAGRVMGAGDVKLFAAAGAWLGPDLLPEAALATALAGGVLALVWMARRLALRLTGQVPALGRLWTALERRPVSVPYGLAIAGGVAGLLWLPT